MNCRILPIGGEVLIKPLDVKVSLGGAFGWEGGSGVCRCRAEKAEQEGSSMGKQFYDLIV